MIRINKDPYPPDVRYTQNGHAFKGHIKWRVAEASMLADFRNDPQPFLEGKYEFGRSYGYVEFRNALERCQGPKCCFCEKPISGGQIEHFRPKAAWKQANGTPLNRPGYYWLAYRWDNMLISCGECNASGQKGNLFPVVDPRGAAHSHCRDEVKTIINPAEEDPSIWVSFNLDQPVAVNDDERGKENIRIFKLKTRADIVPMRRDRLELYQAQRDIASLSQPFGPFDASKIAAAKHFIRKAQKNKHPFAGMIRENIKKGII
ncbi:hypothetical protein [Mucilaginibacter aquariorum]|uniref:TIGR02646 family protein n=1 Tax=Mucilaginibacter aquariorum TaxID=2967225 RepID=A0ABT1T2Y5_9SPHI|nr:hypothetical protein [Mucilaginibacter aquariorum]MCQ6958298.1 hypothetical protein [Mucilaginibacter aquariorum]